MQNQPTLNIGMLGHVANGKTVLTKKLTHKNTQEHSLDVKLNRTVHLGYASCKIWHCPSCNKYKTSPSQTGGVACEDDHTPMELKKHISLVDCPGHNTLMSTMLNGTAVMDAVIFVVTPDGFPKPQTQEHFIVAEMLGLSKNMIICMNKLDLISKQQAIKFYDQVQTFFGQDHPVIPISAIWDCNIDALCEQICKIPEPDRQLDVDPEMIVIRSFDINKPGCKIQSLRGGVAGGSLLRGKLSVGDKIEFRPGLINKANNMSYSPLVTTVTSLFSDVNKLETAEPGGLIAVGTDLDPSFFKENKFVGQMAGLQGRLPDVYRQIQVKYSLVKKIVGDDSKIVIKQGETLKINVNSSDVDTRVVEINKKTMKLDVLNKPICIHIGSTVSMSKTYGDAHRLIGMGIVQDGIKSELMVL